MGTPASVLEVGMPQCTGEDHHLLLLAHAGAANGSRATSPDRY
nr:hypothetical protein OG781_03370 [Streptomyces sp. NBC_00830]